MIKHDVAGRAFAAFPKTNHKYFKVLWGLLAGGVALALYYVKLIQDNGIDVNPGFLVYPAIALLMGIVKVIYEIKLDMPYLLFTEDHYYFDQDGGETRYYWREVEDIREVSLMDRGMPRKDKAVVIIGQRGHQFNIDPREIRFDGADVAEIAREFHKKAMVKIS